MTVALKWITPDAERMIVDCAPASTEIVLVNHVVDDKMKRLDGCWKHQAEPNRNGSYGDHVMADSQLLPIGELRQLLRYDPETGKLFWLPRGPELFKAGAYSAERRAARWNARYARAEAGTDNGEGYLCTRVNSMPCKAHRIAWALHYGEWPELDLDHINGVRSDNRIANLRPATRELNCRNAKRRSDNKTGVSGVRKKGGAWEANIRVDGKQRFLGRFTSIEAAAEARKQAMEASGYSAGHGRA